MNTEQILLEKWRILPSEKQLQVLNLVNTLIEENQDQLTLSSYQPKTPLGAKLLAIRKEIMQEQPPLESWEELEQEIAERRGEESIYLQCFD
ncbi:hypothetical protein [Anabaena sp. UHCC 0204]|uniref:hypothetical protein n=1 Tax=Anabaena sp. UHCC 0204 TaxID=2590009 RepID=UPI0014487887|nr:hypothetical protein [Anabaena sp. UHCC 0204]MTJ08558.1 hypothetical protein [Anabaena sp. UHCC 0204]